MSQIFDNFIDFIFLTCHDKARNNKEFNPENSEPHHES